MRTANLRWLKIGIPVIAGVVLVVTFSNSRFFRDDHSHHNHPVKHDPHHEPAPVVDGEMTVHAAHSAGMTDFRWDHLTPPGRPTTLVELENDLDPVSLNPVDKVVLSYKGFVIRFENDRTRERFRRKPIKYLNQLSLEPQVNGTVVQVNAATYQDAVTELCPFMPESEVDPHGTVYLLHRGWRFYFCCWTGCGDQFMQNPALWYDYYGLKDRAGSLVRVRETIMSDATPNPLQGTTKAPESNHLIPVFASEVAEGAATVTIKVPDMVCQRCSDIVNSELERQSGVLSSRIDISSKTVRVDYRPSLVDLKAIIRSIEAAGYSAVQQQPDAN